MPTDVSDVARELAPTGTLRASINLGNPVLAQGTSSAPSGVTVDLAREIASRLVVPVDFVWLHETVEELRASGFVAEALARSGRADTVVAPRG